MIEKLKKKYKGIEVYAAGLSNFPRNFTRDSIISGILMKNPDMLKNQLKLCSLLQGKKRDSKTGEEPGKIFHEYPSFKLRKLSTKFNACDTTALYLIGHEYYLYLTKDNSLLKKQKDNINSAVEYILNHLNNYLFIEDPKFSDSNEFALKVTYWKDSEIINRSNGEPDYPVIYTLAHIQNLRGIRAAATLLKSRKLKRVSEKMKNQLKKLQDPNGNFYLAIDKKGPIKGISSDILHALFYLNKRDLSRKQIKKIIESSKKLETPIGYRTMESEHSDDLDDRYHIKTVWPFEQALINIGAKKFNLKKIEEVSSKITKKLDSAPEYFLIGNKISKKGCDPQLWTIAAKHFFNQKHI